MATVTKRELVLKLSNELGMTQQNVQQILELTIDAIAEALASGDSVVMRNFGAFHVREMGGKVGRNPKDPAKSLKVPPRAVVKFKPSQSLKDKVSGVLPVLRERSQDRRRAAG
jgi:DNA-binding protein HU-beta/integration host factor subunit alpha